MSTQPLSPQSPSKSLLFLDSEVVYKPSHNSTVNSDINIIKNDNTNRNIINNNNNYNKDSSNNNKVDLPPSSVTSISSSPFTIEPVPIDKVLEMIYAIADITSPSIKIYLFRLNKYLKDENVLKSFVERNGIDQLEKCIKELNGNALTYAYSCLTTISLNSSSLKSFPHRIIETIIQRFSNDAKLKENTLKSMLFIIKRFVGEFPDKTFKSIGPFNKDNKVLIKLVNLLKSSDIDLQLNTISLINEIMGKAIDSQHLDGMIECFKSLDIFLPLRKLIQFGIMKSQKEEMLAFQKSIIRSINHQRLISFETNPTLFINMYNKYKQSILPPGHMSDEWKLLGFQTEEPYHEFHTVGIVGLTNLLYFFDNYPSIIKKIYSTNQKRSDSNRYPFSAISIHLTKLLYQLLSIDGDEKNVKIVPLLFSHYNSFQELFCFTVQVFENSWLDANGDINKILAIVKKHLTIVLESKKSIFDAMNTLTQRNREFSVIGGGDSETLMVKSPDTFNNVGSNFIVGDVNSITVSSISSKFCDTDIYKLVYQNVKNNILESFKNNKIIVLLKGLHFKVEKNYKQKVSSSSSSTSPSSSSSYLFIRLTNDIKQYTYTFTSDNQTIPTKDFIGSINIHEIQITTNSNNLIDSLSNQISSSKKNKGGGGGDSSIIYISNFEKDIDSTPIWLELSTTSKESLIDLIDGHRILNRQPLICMESIEEIASLEDIEMKVNMLDYAVIGNYIGDPPPPVPPPPSDFDFFECKLKDFHHHLSSSNSIMVGNTSNNNNKNDEIIMNSNNQCGRKKMIHRSVRQSIILMEGIKGHLGVIDE